MKTKHTPGPWVFDDLEMKIKGTGDIEGRTVIANVSSKMDYSRGMTTQCANGQLIATAPEMLENELENLKFLRYVESKSRDFNMWSDKLEILYERIAATESAIKKATE